MSNVFTARSPGEPKWIRKHFSSSVYLHLFIASPFFWSKHLLPNRNSKVRLQLVRKYWHKVVQRRHLLFLFMLLLCSYLSNIDFPVLNTHFFFPPISIHHHAVWFLIISRTQLLWLSFLTNVLFLLFPLQQDLQVSKSQTWRDVTSRQLSFSRFINCGEKVLFLFMQRCLHCAVNPVSSYFFGML